MLEQGQLLYWFQLLKFSLWRWFMFILKEPKTINETNWTSYKNWFKMYLAFSFSSLLSKIFYSFKRNGYNPAFAHRNIPSLKKRDGSAFELSFINLPEKNSAQRIYFEVVASWALNRSFPKRIKALLCTCRQNWGISTDNILHGDRL